jgi:hypothetical protein
MNNALEIVAGDLQNHLVEVTLPGEEEKRKLFLIMVTGLTSKLDDLKVTYGEKATSTHLKIAEKIFGTKKTENIYGVFLDSSLKMVFAFNRNFADYNKKGKKIDYKDIDDFLVGKIVVKPSPSKPKPPLPGSHSFSGGGSGLLRYSLVEK